MSRVLEPSPSWFEIDPSFYANGGTCFSQAEVEALGDLAGRRALVGPVTPETRAEEALSLANLGAEVVAWATDEQAAAPGRRLAAETGLELHWAIGTPETLAEEHPRAFDLAYHGWGGLTSTTDIEARSAALAALLAPTGRLVFYDRHPFGNVAELHKGLLVIARSYFPFRAGDNPWTLGDLLNALAATGFALQRLDEFPGSERYPTPLDRLPGLHWDQRIRLPGAMLLTAIRISQPASLAGPGNNS